jgi:micrococcal nuclease
MIALAALLACLSWPYPIKVVDGDTVDRWPVRHRLVGFDAPEIRFAKCAAEKALGGTAKARLSEILAAAQRVDLVRVSARPDPWGRVLSRLEIDGVDVATIAIREGWGAPYAGRGPRRDWCAG